MAGRVGGDIMQAIAGEVRRLWKELVRLRWLVVILIIVLAGLSFWLATWRLEGKASLLASQVAGAILATGLIVAGFEAAISAKHVRLIEEIMGCNRLVHETGLRSVDLEGDPGPLEELMHGAKRLDIAGTTCWELVDRGRYALRRVMQEGCSIRIVVSDPESDFVRLVEAEEEQTGGKTVGHNIGSALSQLAVLCSETDSWDSVHVKLSRLPTRCALILKDNSTLRHSPYLYEGRRVRKISFTFDRSEWGDGPKLFDRYVEHFKTLWDTECEPCNLKEFLSSSPEAHVPPAEAAARRRCGRAEA